MLKNSSAINHVPNEHEDVDQFDPYAIASEIRPLGYTYPESLVNRKEKYIR